VTRWSQYAWWTEVPREERFLRRERPGWACDCDRNQDTTGKSALMKTAKAARGPSLSGFRDRVCILDGVFPTYPPELGLRWRTARGMNLVSESRKSVYRTLSERRAKPIICNRAE